MNTPPPKSIINIARIVLQSFATKERSEDTGVTYHRLLKFVRLLHKIRADSYDPHILPLPIVKVFMVCKTEERTELNLPDSLNVVNDIHDLAFVLSRCEQQELVKPFIIEHNPDNDAPFLSYPSETWNYNYSVIIDPCYSLNGYHQKTDKPFLLMSIATFQKYFNCRPEFKIIVSKMELVYNFRLFHMLNVQKDFFVFADFFHRCSGYYFLRDHLALTDRTKNRSPVYKVLQNFHLVQYILTFVSDWQLFLN
jgi:hypothetical protein